VTERALYVYGVVPTTSPADLFHDVQGVDPTQPVTLVSNGELAAVASSVPLDEFGEDAIEENLRNPRWLADKARAHDRVLAVAVGRTTVLPFRFGAIYRGEEQVRDLLRERTDFAPALRRLEGAVELGVKAYVDPAALRERLATVDRPSGDDVSEGRAYLQRRQLERKLDEDVARFTAECAQESHDRLSAAAEEGRVSPLQRTGDSHPDRMMVFNGAYLVRADDEEGFRDALGALEADYAAHGVRYELTGPWPPYNFVAAEEL
jgi:Gas vesicle synthesis protein GvpL/GvpF